VALFESQRGRVGRSDEERSLFVSGFHGIYRSLIDLLAQQGRMAEAFQVLEASRARSLLSMLAARDLVFDLDVSPEKERARRAVGADYESARQRLERGRAGSQEAALQAKLAELRERQIELEAEIRQASPRLAALREPQPLDGAQVAAHLSPGTLLIAYSVGSERTIAFALDHGGNGPQGYVVPAGEAELRRRIEAWRRLAREPGRRFRAEARRLYALLLGPLAEPLLRAQRVVISADGPLHALPFAALRDQRGYLAESKALAFVPSGTVYAQQIGSRHPRRWGPPAAFGDPLYAGGTLPPLPGSRREVSALAAAFPETRTYLARQATEERVKALERDTRFVHFAVHGLVDERAPLDSALALSTRAAPDANADSGFLYAWEVFERVRLDTDLVTLSACESASGADRRGEGLIGLTRAFLYAGARSVLASLWTVGDASTGAFMKSFYEAWARGATKAEALRLAQVDAIRRGQRPLRWAGFQLYGDDR
jgi:CHAT domain-containing protein